MAALSVDGLKAVASLFTALGCGLTIGRCLMHRRNDRPAARWADHLNAAAALVLVGFIATQFYYLPLYYAVQLWAKEEGPPVKRTDLVQYYYVEVALFFLFWVIIYLAKVSSYAARNGRVC